MTRTDTAQTPDTEGETTGGLSGRTASLISLGLVGAISLAFMAFGGTFEGFFTQARYAVTEYTGWFMIFVMNMALVGVAWLPFGPFRTLRLGGADAKPDFSLGPWISMLFAAGMGIGLLFYAVAEPLAHFEMRSDMPDADAAAEAMNLTFLHWGLHPWAIYALVGLTLAWFHFNKNLPLSFASPLSVLMPAKLAKPVGLVINALAVLGAVFGVATSLGLGAAQAGGGLSGLFGLDNDTRLQVVIIVAVSLTATVSVASGVGRGVKTISSINLVAAIGLLLFVLFAGETLLALKAMGYHMGHYLGHFVETSTWREVYGESDWQVDWTLFYWAWWISWSPFVGVFIARISRGRTVREFATGVLLVPSIFNFFWMTVFGSNALNHEVNGPGFGEVGETESLFALLNLFPAGEIAAGIAVIIILLFFVTSADSGALVTSTLANAGQEPGFRLRGAWALMIMLVTLGLVTQGGLEALQTATILSGAPFAVVLVASLAALMLSLRRTERGEAG
jgi:choline/glycine/proline betaine transport protein